MLPQVQGYSKFFLTFHRSLYSHHMSKSNKSSRRNFIKSAAMAGAAFTIVPRFVLGGKGFIPPSDTVYIAGKELLKIRMEKLFFYVT
jgi:hypothetical protein